MDTRPERMLLLTPGAPARIQFSVPAPDLTKRPSWDATKVYSLCAQLYVMSADGTVIAVTPVVFDAPGSTPAGEPVVVTVSLPEDEATRAALALAGRDGRWDLVLCANANCPSGAMLLESGPAHSTVSTRQRTRVPTGCRDCGKTPLTPPPPFKTGEWSVDAEYKPGDVVFWQGRYYVATCYIPARFGPPSTWPTSGKVTP